MTDRIGARPSDRAGHERSQSSLSSPSGDHPSRGFTPGPWNVQTDGQIWCDDHPIVEKLCRGPWGDEGVDITTGKLFLVHHWGTVATDEAKANARLIAAAPELYAAVEAMIDSMSNNPSISVDAAEDIGLAALSKARGEQVSHD